VVGDRVDERMAGPAELLQVAGPEPAGGRFAHTPSIGFPGAVAVSRASTARALPLSRR
jgi:hypothetical protein